MEIEKDPLPKGMSFIMKSSVFENALQQGGIEIDVKLRYFSSGGIFFDAELYSAKPDYGSYYRRGVGKQWLSVRSGVVKNDAAYKNRRYIENIVIPELIEILKANLSSPNSRFYFRRYPV